MPVIGKKDETQNLQKKKREKVERTGLDLDSVTTIPISDIPPPRRSSALPLKELLRKIPKGEAIFITDKQVSLGTASQSLRKLFEETEFKGYSYTKRVVGNEERLYIKHE